MSDTQQQPETNPKEDANSIRQALVSFRQALGLDEGEVAKWSLLESHDITYLESHDFKSYGFQISKLMGVFGLNLESIFIEALQTQMSRGVKARVEVRPLSASSITILGVLQQAKSVTHELMAECGGLTKTETIQMMGEGTPKHVRDLELLLTFYDVDIIGVISAAFTSVEFMPIDLYLAQQNFAARLRSGRKPIINKQIEQKFSVRTEHEERSDVPKEIDADQNTLGHMLKQIRQRLEMSPEDVYRLAAIPERALQIFETANPLDFYGDVINITSVMNIDIISNIKKCITRKLIDDEPPAFSVLEAPVGVGAYIHYVRQQRTLSSSRVYEFAGVSPATLKSIESGITGRRERLFEKLLACYGLEFSEFFASFSNNEGWMPTNIAAETSNAMRIAHGGAANLIRKKGELLKQSFKASTVSRFKLKVALLSDDNGVNLPELVEHPDQKRWSAQIDGACLSVEGEGTGDMRVEFMGCLVGGYRDIEHVRGSLSKIIHDVHQFLAIQYRT